jgi:tripartite-type tricarboxylate transporter receptor subunit TctC
VSPPPDAASRDREGVTLVTRGRPGLAPRRDIAPVATIGDAAIVMVTNLSFPAKTVPEFISYAKANPGKINMATVGGGASTPYLAGELFKGMTGVEWVWVQYWGEYMPDLIGGQVQAAFNVIPRRSIP